MSDTNLNTGEQQPVKAGETPAKQPKPAKPAKPPKAAKAAKEPKAKKGKPAKKVVAGDNAFTYGGKNYEVILPQVRIPELGLRTAAEICVDEKAQQFLVEQKTEGTVIKEIK